MESSHDLSRLVAASPVGKKTEITLIRDGREKTVSVKLAKRDEGQIASIQGRGTPDDLGLEVADLTKETARRFGHEPGESGVVVLGVRPDGKAMDSGLRPGDIIKEINREPVAGRDDYTKALKSAHSDKKIRILVKRPGSGYIVVTIE